MRSRRERTLEELRPYIERARGFSGWSFDDLAVRALDAPPPWDYEAMARERLPAARRVLDMGTGGGEVLSRIVGAPRAGVVATEHWVVNAPVARDRLAPLGGAVVRANSLRLPFAKASFDLVLNRHEELEPAEVDRVLRPGGTLLTQQVGHENWHELKRFFPRKTEWGDILEEYRRGFAAMGYVVQAQRHRRPIAYATLGDVVFNILVAPWEIEDFDPVREIDDLLALEDALRHPEGLVLTECRDLLVAEKAA